MSISHVLIEREVFLTNVEINYCELHELECNVITIIVLISNCITLVQRTVWHHTSTQVTVTAWCQKTHYTDTEQPQELDIEVLKTWLYYCIDNNRKYKQNETLQKVVNQPKLPCVNTDAHTEQSVNMVDYYKTMTDSIWRNIICIVKHLAVQHLHLWCASEKLGVLPKSWCFLVHVISNQHYRHTSDNSYFISVILEFSLQVQIYGLDQILTILPSFAQQNKLYILGSIYRSWFMLTQLCESSKLEQKWEHARPNNLAQFWKLLHS